MLEKSLNIKKIWFIPILIILIMVSAFFVFNNKNKKSFQNLPINGDYSNIIIRPKDVLILKEGYIGKYLEDGKEISKINLPGKGGKIKGNKDNIIYFTNGNLFFLDKSGNITASSHLKFTIENCILHGDKVLALGKYSYAVLDFTGNLIFTKNINSRVLVGDLSSDKAVITSIDKKNIDKNEINSYVNILDLKTLEETKLTFPREIIVFNKALNNGLVLTVSNMQALVLKDQEIMGKKRVYNFKACDIGENKIFILEDDKLGVFDYNLNNLKKMELKGEFSSLVALEDKVILYNRNGFAQYKNGMVEDYIQTEEIYDIYKTDSDIFFIHSDSVNVE